MPAPINWESKIVLIKTEVTEGVDAAPTGVANSILTIDGQMTPMDGDDVARNLELPYLAAEATVPNALCARLKFKVELAGSGTPGTAPAWGPVLRACGIQQVINAGVSVVYTPISDAMESVTVHFWIGGTRHVMVGARGTAMIRLNAQALPYLEFDLIGLYAAPAEVARPGTVTLTAFQKPQIVNKANTPVFSINAVPLVMRECALNLANKVEKRLLVPTERIIITDRAEEFSARVEAVPLTTFDPYALAVAQTLVPVALTHGTLAGRIAALAIPGAQVKRLSGLANAQKILEWPLELTPLPVAGNDQWSLTLT